MSAVDETLANWRRTEFIWGETDCILSVCDHAFDISGIDPAAPWRGTYDSQSAAEAIYAPFGGVLGLMTHGMARAGFRVCEARSGLPIVADFFGVEVAGVMKTDRIAAFRMEHGVFEGRVKVVKAWQYED